ncbi:endosome-associated-trafficking regulator 1-like [Ruditapes philippinarum]|uniref:endosome-associated-trafficking regulator 1-like n=1 Tax=Ruditapes philippinarum TaxID=129788 RepID=UPI00295C0A9F|nr:endosome-associated-trafficking regulator 1-like [Ruditapes philippinarum]
MAEGGQNPDRDNPFSFKSFVTKKDKKVTTDGKASADDDLDIFDLPDVSNQRKRDKPKQIVVVDEDEGKQGQQKKKGKSANPFSFKKFLSGSGGKSNERSSPLQQQQHVPIVNDDNDDDNLHSVPNLHVTGELPDFVQDHYSDGIGTSPRGLELPDFTIRGITDNGPDIGDTNFHSTDYSSIEDSDRRQGNSADVHSDFDENSDTEDSVPAHRSLVNRLPDFLSDAAVSSSKNSDNVNGSVPIVSRNSRHVDTPVTNHVELQKLQDENLQLKRQLEELRRKKLQDADRISELQRQMVEQKKKEVEETKAMEYAMEQVEQNLSATTKRAVLAESTVTKLKQEVKTLQTELKAIRGENGMLSSDQHLNDVKERTSYVAEQLSSATKTAETSLRQLLSGVDNLKLLSQVLNSIDKISEDTSSTSKTSSDNS